MSNSLDRRTFLKSSGIAALAASAGIRPASGAVRRSKPNLLFLWTDQQRFDTLAAYGNNRIYAPHLNKLAEESVVFERAYVTHPVCTPSRSAVMTGLWPHQTGCTHNNANLPADALCFPELLDDPDYQNGFNGKWHLGDELFPQHGFQEWVGIEDGYENNFSPGRDPNAKSHYHHWLVEKGLEPGRDGSFSRGISARLPSELGKPHFQAVRACEFMERNRNNPFILHVSYLEPHGPFHSPLGIHYPPSIPLDTSFYEEEVPDMPLRYKLRQKYYASFDKFSKDAIGEDGLKAIKAHYWALVAGVDRSVGMILQRLEELGLADNTIIVFTSDHGEMMGAHRMWHKEVMYEPSLRVPLLVKVPGRRRGRSREPFSHIDLVPTLLDLMGGAVPDGLAGRSRKRRVLDPSRTESEPIFAEWSPNEEREKLPFTRLDSGERDYRYEVDSLSPEMDAAVNESTRTIITPDLWKLCLSDGDKSQLYNLNEDPAELRNLYYTGRHTGIIRRLRREIEAWQVRTNDPVAL